MSWEQEVSKAVEWLASALLPSDSPQLADLRVALVNEMEARYTGHWYPSEAHRGCAFRAVQNNGAMVDPLIERALKKAEIARDKLLPGRSFILWVNPGEVKVNDSGAKSHIYCAGGAKPNPYSKPKVNVEPTRLNVECDSDSGAASRKAGSSNASSEAASPTGSPKLSSQPKSLSPSAANFVPRAPGSSESSDTASDSDGEQEVAQMPPLPPQQAGAYNNSFAPPPPPGLMMPNMMSTGSFWPMPGQTMQAPSMWPAVGQGGWVQPAQQPPRSPAAVSVQ